MNQTVVGGSVRPISHDLNNVQQLTKKSQASREFMLMARPDGLSDFFSKYNAEQFWSAAIFSFVFTLV